MGTYFPDDWMAQILFGKAGSNYAWTPEEEPESQTFKRNPEPRKGYLDARNDIVPCVTSLGPSDQTLREQATPLFYEKDYDRLKFNFGLYSAVVMPRQGGKNTLAGIITS